MSNLFAKECFEKVMIELCQQRRIYFDLHMEDTDINLILDQYKDTPDVIKTIDLSHYQICHLYRNISNENNYPELFLLQRIYRNKNLMNFFIEEKKSFHSFFQKAREEYMLHRILTETDFSGNSLIFIGFNHFNFLSKELLSNYNFKIDQPYS